jgi:DNA-binding NtrC family response regulator
MEKETVLVVDDELGPRASLNMILKSLYQVELAENGIAAIQIMQEKEVDLVTMDIRMPGPSGVEVLKKIKEKWPSVEVLVITGYGTLRTALDAIHYGASDYLLKPFDIANLVEVTRRLITRKKRNDEINRFLHQNQDQPGAPTPLYEISP